MGRRELRFGVIDSQGRRSSSWKFWAQGPKKSDLYLSCRAWGGALKVSFHESGTWHVAFTKESIKKEYDDDAPALARFKDRWDRPEDFTPGYSLAFRIVFPWASTSTSESLEDPEPDVTWVTAAPEGHAVEFVVLLGKRTVSFDETEWPGRDTMATELLGSFVLASGEPVWVVHHVIPFELPKLGPATLKLYGEASEKSLQSPGLRASIACDCSDGSKMFIDMPVGTRALDLEPLKDRETDGGEQGPGRSAREGSRHAGAGRIWGWLALPIMALSEIVRRGIRPRLRPGRPSPPRRARR